MKAADVPALLAPALAATMVRALGATLRMRITGTEVLAPSWAAKQPFIYAVWHGRMLMMPWINERLRRSDGARPATVLASRSRDGDLVARYVGRFGLNVVRGSSSRGGAAALRALTAVVEDGDDVVIVPDGPRGPGERLQPGVVALAALTGAPIVPVSFSAWPARRLSTWDAFLVPAPFARAAVTFGTPLVIGRGTDRDRAVKDVQAALDEATASADRLVAR